MKGSWKYIGLFFSPEDAADMMTRYSRDTLANPIEDLHVTFRYRPDTVDTALFGREVAVEITGYGNNGENEGVSVALHTEDPALQDMIREIPLPHITLSIGPGAQAVNTRYLDFRPVERMVLTGCFGGYDSSLGVLVGKCQ